MTKTQAYYSLNRVAVLHNQQQRRLRANIKLGDLTIQRPIGPFPSCLPSLAREQLNMKRSEAAYNRRIQQRTSGSFYVV